MCIALFSTAHPKYALIVATNRDEYLHRPTARAAWWEAPDGHVLGGRDLESEARGTWLGVTADGRIATLTNFREEGAEKGTVSRGTMVNAYLTRRQTSSPSSPSPTDRGGSGEKEENTETFARKLVTGEGARGTGGFTLVCGRMGVEPLAVVSNRMADPNEVAWIGSGSSSNSNSNSNISSKTLGLSNAAFGNRSWPKVVRGEELMGAVIAENAATEGGAEELVEKLLAVLSVDTLPTRRADEDTTAYIRQLRHSIFVPVLNGFDPRYGGDPDAAARSSDGKLPKGAYGTSKQTVVLLDHDRNVTFVEKTLHEDGAPVADGPDSTRRFHFKATS